MIHVSLSHNQDFYHFIDLLGQAVCNVVVLDIDVDANIAQLVWLKLWAMFKLLPIYLRSPIGFCAPLYTIVFSSKEKYSTQKICHPLIFHICAIQVQAACYI